MTPEALLGVEARHKEGHALSCGCGKCAASAHEDCGLLLDLLERLGQVDFVYSEHPGYPCWLCAAMTAKGPCRPDCPSHALKALVQARAHPDAARSPLCKWCPDGHPKPGDYVQSRYQAKWKGTVLAEEWVKGGAGEPAGILLLRVRQEVDRRGNPIRNRKTVRYGVCFFRKIEKEPSLPLSGGAHARQV